VETEAEALALGKFGVEFGQGYWFGRPQPLQSP
jgi:EAL domain-containing protein (putative c-di-GMP-specific phosphodiesterase class I)